MREHKGFTLVEMLIVVAVIAILIFVAIPVFSAQLERARAATCDANLTSCIHLLYAEEMSEGGALSDGAMTNTLRTGMDATIQGGGYKKIEGKALCPDDGAYEFTYDPQSHTITGRCTVHGAPSGATAMGMLATELGKSTSEAAKKLTTVGTLGAGPDGSLDYPLPKGLTLVGYKSNQYVEAMFKDLGLDISTGSWRVIK